MSNILNKTSFLGALALVLTSALGTSCTPGGDVDVEQNKFLIYNLDSQTGEYRLSRESITTIRDVRSADGDVISMQGGGKLATPYPDPQTKEEWEKALTIEGAQAPVIEYTIDDDGTVVPWDFDSAMILTVYHHIERANVYFDNIPLDDALRADLGGGVGELVGKIPCFYYPSVTIAGIPLPLFTDNAAYAYTMNAFIVPPRLSLDDAVPIYANRGVMTHEYSHAVFNRLVYNGERVPAFVLEKWDSDPFKLRAYNELGGLDEGIADIFGAFDTNDPNYIAASISTELIDRDLAVPRYYEECLHMAVESGVYPASADCGGDYAEGGSGTDSQGVRFDYAAGGQYDSHHLGAVAASVIWALYEQNQEQLGGGVMERIVVQSLRDIQNPDDSFRITEFFDAVYENMPADLQPEACQLFQERLIVIRDELQCQP